MKILTLILEYHSNIETRRQDWNGTELENKIATAAAQNRKTWSKRAKGRRLPEQTIEQTTLQLVIIWESDLNPLKQLRAHKLLEHKVQGINWSSTEIKKKHKLQQLKTSHGTGESITNLDLTLTSMRLCKPIGEKSHVEKTAWGSIHHNNQSN